MKINISKSTKGTKPFVLTLFVVLSILLLSFKKKENLKKIVFAWDFPFAEVGGGVLKITDSMPIYYYENYTLYGISYKNLMHNGDSIISTDRKYNYLIFRNKDKYGYYFNYKNYKASRKVDLDSFSKNDFLEWRVAYDDNYKLIASLNGKSKKYKCIEKYLTKNIKDESYPDTVTFYYTDKIKDIRFSLAKNRDSIKKLKVCKIRHRYNAQVYKGNSFQFPERNLTVSFREDTIANPKQILQFFEYYKNKK